MSDGATVDEHLENAVRSFGTPAYVYFTTPIEERAQRLRAAFGGRFALS
jgi:diaminopimelate decarboxylase